MTQGLHRIPKPPFFVRPHENDMPAFLKNSNIRKRCLRVDGRLHGGGKKLCFQKYPYSCERGLTQPQKIYSLPPMEKQSNFVFKILRNEVQFAKVQPKVSSEWKHYQVTQNFSSILNNLSPMVAMRTETRILYQHLVSMPYSISRQKNVCMAFVEIKSQAWSN